MNLSLEHFLFFRNIKMMILRLGELIFGGHSISYLLLYDYNLYNMIQQLIISRNLPVISGGCFPFLRLLSAGTALAASLALLAAGSSARAVSAGVKRMHSKQYGNHQKRLHAFL